MNDESRGARRIEGETWDDGSRGGWVRGGGEDEAAS
jgi:hypothetical protein